MRGPLHLEAQDLIFLGVDLSLLVPGLSSNFSGLMKYPFFERDSFRIGACF